MATKPPGLETPALLLAAFRVNSAKMALFHGSTVRLVGRVLSINGTRAEVEATDHGRVSVVLTSNPQIAPNMVVEFLGKIEGPSMLTEMKSSIWTDIDFETYDKMVNLQHQYSDLFLNTSV